MLSNVSVPILGLVDTAILGHLTDSRYLAAVAMGSSLLAMVMWSFAFLRMGTTALIARYYNQAIEVSGILQSALLLAVIIGGCLILLAPWLIEFMVTIVGAAQDITPLAKEYLTIRFYFAPVTLLNYVVLGYFIGKGLTHINLILLVSTNLINGALNYYFVYELNWFSAGVAWGTNAAELFQLCLGLFFIKESIIQKKAWPNMRQRFRQFIDLNFQLFVRTFLLLFAFAFFMAQGAQHSAALLSANAILINLLMFMSNALDGFAVASESMVGQSIADKKGKTLKSVITDIIKASGIWSLVTAIIFTILLAFTYPYVFKLLTSQYDVIALLNALALWLIFLPMVGFASYWLDGIYIGLANAKQMKNSLVFSVIIIFLPVSYLFSFWEFHGLWLAMYSFLLARAFWLVYKLPQLVRNFAN